MTNKGEDRSMQHAFTPVAPGSARLLPGEFLQRYELNRRYLMSLRPENLLQSHYMEAGLWNPRHRVTDIHWGWESPTCQIRGTFLGHWLSAAARGYAWHGDAEIKARADAIVAEVGRCQRENGGEWAGPIPPQYLDWAASGKSVWAPQYVVHKNLMGLVEMYQYAGNEQALEIAERWAGWLDRWSAQFSRAQMDDLLDVETGGMLEVWADLYGITGNERYLNLMNRYYRGRLFDRLLAGEDPLTNRHANTTVPEAQGAARAWEVTGDRRWRDIVEAYWRCAVTERGYFATGGQTCGEIWTPPFEQAGHLSEKNQEHCVVYNMMRLADYLLRWTGDVTYADYWERNLYNGVFAQQCPPEPEYEDSLSMFARPDLPRGMVAYFLPLHAGGYKRWGRPTEDFWCCHGSLVQAHSRHAYGAHFVDADGLVLSQYVPSELNWQRDGINVKLTLEVDPQTGETHRPNARAYGLAVTCGQPVEFTLKVRLPWWLAGQPAITVNGSPLEAPQAPSSFYAIRRVWSDDRLHIVLPKHLTAWPLTDRPNTVAFMDGPVVLAGLIDDSRALVGDVERPESMLAPDNVREWTSWRSGWHTYGQERDFRLLPLADIGSEHYTVYFPVRKKA
jgi:DUF1680 family protein